MAHHQMGRARMALLPRGLRPAKDRGAEWRRGMARRARASGRPAPRTRQRSCDHAMIEADPGPPTGDTSLEYWGALARRLDVLFR